MPPVNIIGHSVITQLSILIRIIIHDTVRGIIIRVVLPVNQIAFPMKKKMMMTQTNTRGDMKEIDLSAITLVIGFQKKMNSDKIKSIQHAENHDQNLNIGRSKKLSF